MGEAGADATKNAYCDKELAESTEKKSDKTDEIEKISTRIDSAEAASAQLKEEVATLQNELSKLAKTQAEMDKLRKEEHDTYVASKAELEKGIEGIKLALQILREYYAADGKAHESADGAASGIIGMLEVIEADFSKNLAQINADEEGAAAAYQATTKENEIDCIAKAETFAARAARFAAEIAGLKEALQILESETALVQRQARRTLRGARHSALAL